MGLFSIGRLDRSNKALVVASMHTYTCFLVPWQGDCVHLMSILAGEQVAVLLQFLLCSSDGLPFLLIVIQGSSRSRRRRFAFLEPVTTTTDEKSDSLRSCLKEGDT